jgi:hypothetical protein
MFYAAKQQQSLPKGIDSALLTTHARKPFSYSAAEIAELASEIKDPSFRIQVSEKGIHVYNRDGLITADDPFSLFPELESLQDDAPHAFYMGVELARAQIAMQLGKRYIQDDELDWGAARGNSIEEDALNSESAHKLRNSDGYKEAGTTLKAGKRRRQK